MAETLALLVAVSWVQEFFFIYIKCSLKIKGEKVILKIINNSTMIFKIILKWIILLKCVGYSWLRCLFPILMFCFYHCCCRYHHHITLTSPYFVEKWLLSTIQGAFFSNECLVLFKSKGISLMYLYFNVRNFISNTVSCDNQFLIFFTFFCVLFVAYVLLLTATPTLLFFYFCNFVRSTDLK